MVYGNKIQLGYPTNKVVGIKLNYYYYYKYNVEEIWIDNINGTVNSRVNLELNFPHKCLH